MSKKARSSGTRVRRMFANFRRAGFIMATSNQNAVGAEGQRVAASCIRVAANTLFGTRQALLGIPAWTEDSAKFDELGVNDVLAALLLALFRRSGKGDFKVLYYLDLYQIFRTLSPATLMCSEAEATYDRYNALPILLGHIWERDSRTLGPA